MPGLDLSPIAQQWINAVLLWLGFGILTGLLARVLVPGREPGGAAGTLLVGMLGSLLGPLALSGLFQGRGFNPIGPLGILAAVGSAAILMLALRALGACFAAPEPQDEDPD
ncbi:MAG: GlsB/YeaQ/YmgE family stress response membrane protein [Thermoguttaceae bacterium]